MLVGVPEGPALTGAAEVPAPTADELAAPDPAAAVPDAVLLPAGLLLAGVLLGAALLVRGVLLGATLVRGAELVLTVVGGRDCDERGDVGPELAGWLVRVALVAAGVLCGTVELPGEETGDPIVSAR